MQWLRTKKTSLLIDMLVPTVDIISVKEYNKISKFKHLEFNEIERR